VKVASPCEFFFVFWGGGGGEEFEVAVLEFAGAFFEDFELGLG